MLIHAVVECHYPISPDCRENRLISHFWSNKYNEPKTRTYGTVLTSTQPFLWRRSQLARGKPPGPPGTHL